MTEPAFALWARRRVRLRTVVVLTSARWRQYIVAAMNVPDAIL
jgi:hypothetical protein